MKLVPFEKEGSGFNHVVGELIGGVQTCLMCGCVITDYRGWMMVDDGSSKPLKGFPKGPVHVIGHISSIGVDESLPYCMGQPPEISVSE